VKDNFTKFLYWTLGLFIIGIIIYISMMTIFACGFSQDCSQGKLPVERTPLAVPPVAEVPAVEFRYAVEDDSAMPVAMTTVCNVVAADFVDAWSAAGYPEDEPFTFVDLDGVTCEATADDARSVMVMGASMDVVISIGEPVP